MNKRQASALLELIADLYTLINAPDPEVPNPEFNYATNGEEVRVK